MTRPPRSSTDRAQLGFDYMVGMSVFLLAVFFVVGYLSSIFDPFTIDSSVKMIVSDRSAARLAGVMLVNHTAEGPILNETCTANYFDGATPLNGCDFTTDGQDLHDSLGVSSVYNLNVTIESQGNIVTVQSVRATAGPPPGSKADVIQARRLVLLNGSERFLTARTW